MRKALILFAIFILMGLASQVQAQVGDLRVNVHLYAVDDSVRDSSDASNTWKIVTTGTDTSEIFTTGPYTNFTIIARVDSINAADSAEFVLKPWVSNDNTTWAYIGDSLLVQWGTVATPAKRLSPI